MFARQHTPPCLPPVQGYLAHKNQNRGTSLKGSSLIRNDSEGGDLSGAAALGPHGFLPRLFPVLFLFAFGLSEFWGFGFICCEVWGLEFRGWGLGFGMWGLGFGVWASGFGVEGSTIRVWGVGIRVWGLGFGVWILGFRV